jgi:hypothetical protein
MTRRTALSALAMLPAMITSSVVTAAASADNSAATIAAGLFTDSCRDV